MQGVPWTQLIDASLTAAHEELGVTEDDVRSAARSTPFHPALREVCLPASFCCVLRLIAVIRPCTHPLGTAWSEVSVEQAAAPSGVLTTPLQRL